MNRVLKEKDKPLLETAKEQLQSDKGFTLMEMLLCVLLSCIVISAIGNFMVAAIKQYNSVDREINLQIEAQTVVNQLGKMIKEADNVVFKKEGRDSYAVIYSDLEKTLETNPDSPAGARIKIVWYHANADTSKPGAMYLFEIEKDSTKYSNAIAEIKAGTTTNASFMTNYVAGFSLARSDGTDLNHGLGNDKNSVNIKVDLKNVFKKDKKEYTATDTITLRNKVVQLP